jgi:conjugative relaxase-like TrwC/TraI family protein
MSLWKLRVGVESYYLAQIASGLDEYYTGAGEAPGAWTATGSGLLGLGGKVTPEDLRAVLAGLAPGTGLTPNGAQLASHPRRVPGFDLTFSVPKSVSVLWALGDPLVQAELTAGCETALAEALGWLEREACFVRRGTNNRKLVRDPAEFGTRRMVGEGFIAAQFPHRTSRLGDPHLHWHVLVANMARGIDGRWTALDGTALYRAQRPVGVIFQAAMRRELTQRLGIEWGPVHNDSAEIAGVPARVLREFSRRHEQIAEWLDLTGQSGAAAVGQALLETRTSKHQLDDFRVLEADWRQRAEAVGWGQSQLDALLAAASPARPVDGMPQRWVIPVAFVIDGQTIVVENEVPFDAWVDRLLTQNVTEKSGTFTRFDLTRAIAAELPVGTSLDVVERVVAAALASPAVVQVGDHWAERPELHAPRRAGSDDRALLYTARSLLLVEQKMLDEIARGVGAGVGIVDRQLTDASIASSSLDPDQAAAVRHLTVAGDRVGVMVGRAGTGKTHTLGTLRQIYASVGWNLVGLAPSARAARELQDGSGIASTTIARHRVEQRTITATTLVVIDEAAMAGTRDVAAIIDQATAAGAKVLLVGDHHQLPEVSTGGAFRAALDTLGDRAVELTINRRQRHEWERLALDELRCGEVTTAFAAYRDHGRVVIAAEAEDVHALVLADWHEALAAGRNVLLLAGTRSEARLLNRYARQLLVARGELDLADEVTFAGRGFVVGDRVVLCKNHRDQHLTNGEGFAVDNGMRGIVTSIGADHMAIRTTNGDDVVLDVGYLERGWVDHAYAVTIHKAQGATCDVVFVVGPAGLYREGAYVAMSRGRDGSWIYITVAQAADILEAHRLGIPLPTEPDPDPEVDLLDRLNISAAKNLVTLDDPDAATVAALVDAVPAPELLQRTRHARHAELACGVDNPAAARAALDAAVATREHVAVGRRVRAIDRDNVGLVIGIDDRAGSCEVHFESTDGRTAIKTLDWSELVVIDHPGPVEVTATARATLDARHRAVSDAEHAWAAALAEHGVSPGEADLYRRALHTAIDDAARHLRAQQPAWLTTWIGQRPTTASAAAVWGDATTRIAHHRAIHNIPVEEPGLGECPDGPGEAARWQQLMVRILEDRLWLADHRTPQVHPLAARTPVELIARRHELEQLLAAAPADQRGFIDRLVGSRLGPTEMHEYLAAAMAIQDARRDWILANWPHLVELEQVNRLVADQEPLSHWPTAQPAEVQRVLDALRALAPEVETREDRTLTEIDRAEANANPVHRLEARREHLRVLAASATVAERGAIEAELAHVGDQLRAARRERQVESAFNRYTTSPWDALRAARATTLAHDVLTTQPPWLIEAVRRLHEEGQLNTEDVPSVANALVRRAVAQDRETTVESAIVVREPTAPGPAPSL